MENKKIKIKKNKYVEVNVLPVDFKNPVQEVLSMMENNAYPVIPGFSAIRSYVMGVTKFLTLLGIKIHASGATDEELASSFLWALWANGLAEDKEDMGVK